MSKESLSDLESLLLRVRDPKSRQTLEDAVMAYYGGGFRAAILSTWVAVAYDIIEKIRELAAYEDPQAIQLIEALNAKIASKDIRGLSALEDSLLEKAEQEFQLISAEQKTQLQRIKDDRNLCAHPAFTEGGSLFEPLPELVRSHIAHAVNALLQHAPVRGRSSLKAITEDIRSGAFPVTPKAAGRFLEEKYLRYAKLSLVENLLKVLVKAVLEEIPEWQLHREHAIVALQGLAIAKARQFDAWMAANFGRLVDRLAGGSVFRLFGLLARDQRFWGWIGEQHRIQLIDFLKRAKLTRIHEFDSRASGIEMIVGALGGVLGASERARLSASMGLASVEQLFALIDIPELTRPLLDLFDRLSPQEQIAAISKSPRPEFGSAAIKLYASAGAYRYAESIGRDAIVPMAPYLSAGEIQDILNTILENRQIHEAGGTNEILMSFVNALGDRSDINLARAVKWKPFIERLKALYDHYGDLEQLLKEKRLLTS